MRKLVYTRKVNLKSKIGQAVWGRSFFLGGNKVKNRKAGENLGRVRYGVENQAEGLSKSFPNRVLP